MNVYIAASDRYKAMGLFAFLKSKIRGLICTSDWMLKPSPPQTDELKLLRVTENLASISKSDILILMSDYDMVPGGKFFEAGYAHALGKPVFVVGATKPENMYMGVAARAHCFNVEVLTGELKAFLADNPTFRKK